MLKIESDVFGGPLPMVRWLAFPVVVKRSGNWRSRAQGGSVRPYRLWANCRAARFVSRGSEVPLHRRGDSVWVVAILAEASVLVL